MKYLLKCILICVFFANNLLAQNNLKIEQKIDSLFSKYNSNTSGVAVGVVKNGILIYKKGYGIANLEYDIPISPKTIFNVGSVSKQFTTFSIYLLEKQGKISLDDDIRKHIPELPLYEKKITIKQQLNLLKHSCHLFRIYLMQSYWIIIVMPTYITTHLQKLIYKIILVNVREIKNSVSILRLNLWVA